MIAFLITSVVAIAAESSAETGFEAIDAGEFGLVFDPAHAQAETPAVMAPDSPTAQPFGLAESAYWTANLTGGSDFRESYLARAGIGVSYFMADDISLDVDINAIYFSQDDGDAAGANANLLLRWHFFHDEDRTWSVYVDGGAGLLLTSDDVPETGTEFNFTPQLGAGVSFDIGEGMRLFTGLRWFHVSNARLYTNNPGRDYGMVYALVSWPF